MTGEWGKFKACFFIRVHLWPGFFSVPSVGSCLNFQQEETEPMDAK